jgi:hypothetical protein
MLIIKHLYSRSLRAEPIKKMAVPSNENILKYFKFNYQSISIRENTYTILGLQLLLYFDK